MALRISWSRKASDNLDKILDHLQEEWGDQSTKDFVNRVYSLLDILTAYPEIGKLQFPQRNIRGFVIVKQVTLYYKFENKNIVLLSFFSTLQNPNKKP